MIIYQDKSKENIQVAVSTENTAVLNISAFTIKNTRVAAQNFDLTGFQGKAFRLYAEENGDLSTNKNQDHFWLLAEANIPERMMQSVSTGKTDVNGQEIIQSVEVALDLNKVDITIFALPEVAE
jgi:hypothetical protein